ncbi:hypothetical protein GCM10027280_52360 [Micromonospora polyrhachis]|uniref:Uncharacterized protein n=1 Tax=Micromonospora polyrhachis TaxID=1282883 RepID=A0A7W7SLW9_9ACTN|nr:hypothetical protein [Micromonospora polyrhachis]MBB4957203.1 hypothetical protein [Micromonospora polyrhachis]
MDRDQRALPPHHETLEAYAEQLADVEARERARLARWNPLTRIARRRIDRMTSQLIATGILDELGAVYVRAYIDALYKAIKDQMIPHMTIHLATEASSGEESANVIRRSQGSRD